MPDINSIEANLRKQLPDEKKQASLGYLAQQFPFYPVLHWLRAYNHPTDNGLKQMAALYANDTFRLHIWLNGKEGMPVPAEVLNKPDPIIHEKSAESIENEIDIAEKEPDDVDEILLPDNAGNIHSMQPAVKEEVIPEIISPDGNEEIQPKPFVFSPEKGMENQPSDFVFEPYHTVDYFASQGIRVEKGSDTPLDRQVKSFTEWLKSMKKLSYQPAASYTDPLVERQARSSLAAGEVVTEAMAEVWAKQGQMDKAEAVFMKLKLLHPEKSHYFAARLKDIKENS